MRQANRFAAAFASLFWRQSEDVSQAKTRILASDILHYQGIMHVLRHVQDTTQMIAPTKLILTVESTHAYEVRT